MRLRFWSMLFLQPTEWELRWNQRPMGRTRGMHPCLPTASGASTCSRGIAALRNASSARVEGQRNRARRNSRVQSEGYQTAPSAEGKKPATTHAGNHQFSYRGFQMSKVIRILESLGAHPNQQSWSSDDTNHLNEVNSLSPELRTALLKGDQQLLVKLLGARSNIFCGVFPAKQDEDESETTPSKKEEEPKDDTEKASSNICRALAIAS
jgi:hypothetical protein